MPAASSARACCSLPLPRSCGGCGCGRERVSRWRKQTACAYGRVMYPPAVSCEPSPLPRIILLGSSPSACACCAMGGGRRRLGVRADERGCARKRGRQSEEKERRVRSSRVRAMPMPMRTRGAVSSGTGPAASSDLSPQVLLQGVTVPSSRIATSVLVWVNKSVLAASMLRAGSTPSAGDGRGRGEGTGTGARAESVSSTGGAGGTRSSGGFAKGRREVVGSARKIVAMPTRPVSHTCEVVRHARARARVWTAHQS
jgi:hypothetical protein